ncbi:ribosomal protein [Lithospermum erythrorhizon]|uniref:Large ribosomal subunit protein bL12c n=1 Tax=Lithospermum erythrorhizon TaxID=34254 RepID=A0AAV3P6X7_LITER
MSSPLLKSPYKSLIRALTQPEPLLRAFSTTPESPTQKLTRIADELLSLNKLERHDYAVLFRNKMGLNRYGPEVSGLASSSGPAVSEAATEAKTAEKTAFDVKLEKFDAAGKIKVIKEIRGFTELGLKEAKELVEKAPVVVKKGVSKDEADAILEKLKGVGATAVLE